ncbi:penicillin-binding protein A [Pilimelia terevasa]|uniref:Penicillin-binding protein A n=1 Tax=Pilimelia terevasa TaxID=53372 RepID=A0A8J3BSD4_9ACTN|nr:penicillin-binding transpeptidase domain-containing protein [Pilimelia terevasa]GGK35028.1 penicillin-binding protein A [Pilimelia terevasa]
MNAPLRKIGVVVLILFGLLFANLNWVQAYKADEYRESEFNSRGKLEEYLRQRGAIEAQGKALATSVETEGRFRYLRKYPFAGLYAHVVGYKPLNLGAIDIERSENAFLAGSSDRLIGERIKEMLTGKKTGGGHVLLTVSPRTQQAAFNALSRNSVGARRGAAVAIDPRTGAVQALVSVPTYDPNPLVSHNTVAAQAAYNRLLGQPDRPLNNRATAETLPPGSTFKVIVAAAALESGLTPATAIPAGSSYRAPGTTQEIRNAVPSICPESQVTLNEALTESCNTGFAQLGVRLGADRLKEKARAFGFGDDGLTVGRLDDGGIPTAPSQTGDMRNPNGSDDTAAVAQSSIGQRDVRMTPLAGAMVAAAIANDGRQMRPYVVRQLLGPDRGSLYNASPDTLREPVGAAVAASLRQMMVSVVRSGTGRNAQISGYEVGGKTGTAQNGDAPDHGWFVGFVRDSGGTPISAVAVVLENAGSGGSGEATQIAGEIMRAVIADPRRGG